MDIAIFGASGGTGLLLTQRCLKSGHQVTALLRTPEKFSLCSRIRVFHGSPFNPASVRQTIEGADVVFSALGANSLKKEEVLERAVPQIVAAMQQTAAQPNQSAASSSWVRPEPWPPP
jgi:putative NADH-flavin reductase